MSVLLAGEGGSVLVRAAASPDPSALLALEGLAGEARTPWGARALPAELLPPPGEVEAVELVAGEPATRAALRAWAQRHGTPVRERRVEAIDIPGVRVVAVSAPSTGSAKTALTRRVARALARSGVRVAVVRHPSPNLLLWPEAAAPRLLREPPPGGPLEVREELAPVLGAGVPVAMGLDPQAVAEAAAAEADVLVWDGGGSAEPWLRPDLHLVAVDLLRPPPEGARERVAAADAVVLTKADSAHEARAREIEAAVRSWNPSAPLTLADLTLAVSGGPQLIGRRVVVVEDWPSLLLGGLKAGAGAVVARRFRNGVVDPRPFAVGAIREALERHPHVGPVIPSLGRTPRELDDLRASIAATPGDAVLWASPASPEGIVDGRRPVHRVYPELVETAGSPLVDVLRPLWER